jgi:hypothetical protein
MIAKDLLPWMFVKRTASWTPYAKIRSESERAPAVQALGLKPGRRPNRRPPRG